MGRSMRRRNVRAWLITWEGDHESEDSVAMLLHPRTPPRRVGEVIELLYVNACGTCGERLVYATERNDWNYPYRAHSPDWRGRDCTGLVCGKNPYLYARLVTCHRGARRARSRNASMARDRGPNAQAVRVFARLAPLSFGEISPTRYSLLKRREDDSQRNLKYSTCRAVLGVPENSCIARPQSLCRGKANKSPEATSITW